MILVGEIKLEAPKKTFEFALRIWLAVRWAYSPSWWKAFRIAALQLGMVTSDRYTAFRFRPAKISM